MQDKLLQLHLEVKERRTSLVKSDENYVSLSDLHSLLPSEFLAKKPETHPPFYYVL